MVEPWKDEEGRLMVWSNSALAFVTQFAILFEDTDTVFCPIFDALGDNYDSFIALHDLHHAFNPLSHGPTTGLRVVFHMVQRR